LWQIVFASGVPTQVVLSLLLSALGLRAGTLVNPLPLFVAVVALTDAAVVLILIHVFLTTGGERTRAVLVGDRPARELVLGLLLLPATFVGLLITIDTIARVFPSLHNVAMNPYEEFFHRRVDALLFAVVVVVAGGIREEAQRGFILHRFGQRLGGAAVGLLVWSLAFGLGHYAQGWDVAIGMAGAGAFWGWLYLRRRSVLAPMANHAAFDLLQVAKMAATRSLGG
jgi:membrane protease YdiL (CAAX protease family)